MNDRSALKTVSPLLADSIDRLIRRCVVLEKKVERLERELSKKDCA